MSDGLTIPLPHACTGLGSDCWGAVMAPFKCFLPSSVSKFSHFHHNHNSLPPFALLNHAFNTIHRAIRTRDFSIGRYMISLHDIAPHLPRPTRCAGLGSSPLDGLRIPIAVQTRRRSSPFLGRVVLRGRRRLWGIGAVVIEL